MHLEKPSDLPNFYFILVLFLSLIVSCFRISPPGEGRHRHHVGSPLDSEMPHACLCSMRATICPWKLGTIQIEHLQQQSAAIKYCSRAKHFYVILVFLITYRPLFLCEAFILVLYIHYQKMTMAPRIFNSIFS